jgi:hypothetical protein
MESIVTLTDDLRTHLLTLEEQLLEPELRHNPSALSLLIADDFLEIGSSGRVYDKPAILDALESEAPAPTALLSDFNALQLAHNVMLVTYRTTRCNSTGEPSATARRSSIWIHRDSRWQITFHQGTPLP